MASNSIEFFIHSGSGIDDPALIGSAPDIDAAKKIAAEELRKHPSQIVTIVDRFGINQWEAQ